MIQSKEPAMHSLCAAVRRPSLTEMFENAIEHNWSVNWSDYS